MPSLMGKVASTVRSSQPFNSCVRDRAAISNLRESGRKRALLGRWKKFSQQKRTKVGKSWQNVGKTWRKHLETGKRLGKRWVITPKSL